MVLALSNCFEFLHMAASVDLAQFSKGSGSVPTLYLHQTGFTQRMFMGRQSHGAERLIIP